MCEEFRTRLTSHSPSKLFFCFLVFLSFCLFLHPVPSLLLTSSAVHVSGAKLVFLWLEVTESVSPHFSLLVIPSCHVSSVFLILLHSTGVTSFESLTLGGFLDVHAWKCVWVWICVRVCERERQRERAAVTDSTCMHLAQGRAQLHEQRRLLISGSI